MANLTITDDDSVLSDSINHDESQDVYKKCFTLRDYYKQCLSFYHKGELLKVFVLLLCTIPQFQEYLDDVPGVEQSEIAESVNYVSVK
jgi:hypothetical protein